MKRIINKMEMHVKTVVLVVDFMTRAWVLKIWSLFQKDQMKVLDKCIWYFERGHLVLSQFYKEAVEKDLEVNKKVLDCIDQYNEWIWQTKQWKEKIRALI